MPSKYFKLSLHQPYELNDPIDPEFSAEESAMSETIEHVLDISVLSFAACNIHRSSVPTLFEILES